MIEFQSDKVYYKKNLDFLSHHYTSADTNRMTLAYFCISGLDLLGELDSISTDSRNMWVDWVYAQMIVLNSKPEHEGRMGFRGGPFAGAKYDPVGPQSPCDDYDTGHLAMTYTALVILIILGDDLSRVDRKSILESIQHLQRENGSYIPCKGSSEADMRFLFCACAISFILNDWSGIDKERACEFIKSSMSYDGGFGQGLNLESHGGSTYCAIAALKLMNKMDVVAEAELKSTTLWCLQRQCRGFSGRSGKVEDTCYAFWIGGAIDMLGAYQHVDKESLFDFMFNTHTKFGGFCKLEEDDYPDLLHSYMGLAGLCIAGYPGLPKLDSSLNMSQRAYEWMKQNVIYWK